MVLTFLYLPELFSMYLHTHHIVHHLNCFNTHTKKRKGTSTSNFTIFYLTQYPTNIPGQEFSRSPHTQARMVKAADAALGGRKRSATPAWHSSDPTSSQAPPLPNSWVSNSQEHPSHTPQLSRWGPLASSHSPHPQGASLPSSRIKEDLWIQKGSQRNSDGKQPIVEN